MKKLLKVGLGTLALGALFAVGNDASASSSMSINVDYAKQQLKITDANEAVIKVSYTANKAGKAVKLGKEDVYDNSANGVTVDISHLGLNKDNLITVRGGSEAEADTRLIEIPARDAKIAAVATYTDAGAVSVKMTDKSKPAKDITSDRHIEYRTAYSNWIDTTGVDLSMYTEKGANLFVRWQAGAAKTLAAADFAAGTTATAFLGDNSTPTGKYAKIDNLFPGVEVKAKIAKRLAAPNLTANYVKQEITLTKADTAEYRVYSNDAAAVTAWKSVATELVTESNKPDAKGNLTISLSALNVTKVSTLEIRTKATATAPASVIKQLPVNPVLTLTSAFSTSVTTKSGDDNPTTTAGTAVNYIGWKKVVTPAEYEGEGEEKTLKTPEKTEVTQYNAYITNGLTGDDLKNLLEVVLTVDEKKKTATIALKNNTLKADGVTYKCVVADPTADGFNVYSAKVAASVAGGTAAKPGEGKITIKDVDKEIKSHLFIYQQENKKTGDWVSNAADLGLITITLPSAS